MKYHLIRTCNNCQNEDSFEFTKIQSAFELYDANEIWDKKCSKCESTSCYSLQYPKVNIDQEILDLWGRDENLYLNPQDEEIILAEMQYFPLILKSINDGKYLKRKNEILLESLCVLLYENILTTDEFSNQENQERAYNANIIRLELIKLKDRIKESEKHIMDYIRIVVFPEIGIY